MRELHNPITDKEANSLTSDEKDWLRNWNREDEIPGEGSEDAEPEDDEGEGDGDGEYDGLSNDQLREELANRELPTGGNKADLVARLEEDDAEQE